MITLKYVNKLLSGHLEHEELRLTYIPGQRYCLMTPNFKYKYLIHTNVEAHNTNFKDCDLVSFQQ